MSHSRQRSTDVGAAVSDVADLLALLPSESQLGLVEILVRKLASSSSHSVAKSATAPLVAVGTPTGTLKRVVRYPAGRMDSPNPWDTVAVAIDRVRADFERHAAGRPLSESLTATLRLPDEVLPIAVILNNLHDARGARHFLELDAVLGITPAQRRDPLAAIKDAMLTILIHAPGVLVSSTAFTPTLQKLPGAEDEYESHSPLARILIASSALAALIEAMVLRHNDRILASLNDQRGLEDYQRISEGVWEATSGMLKDVKRLKEGMPAGASWSQAQYLYAHVIQVATQFSAALVDYVAFADTALPEPSSGEIDIPPVTVTLSPPETPPVEPSSADTAAVPSDPAAASASNDRTSKQKSLGARLMHRLSQLTETARRSSTYSNSSDGSMSETSQPTRFSRQSDTTYDFTEASGSNNLNVGVSRRPSSFDIPRRSVDTVTSTSLSPPTGYLNVGRSSLDALRPRLADITPAHPQTHNRSAGGTALAQADRPPMPPTQPRRTSQATPPTLPEISRGHYKAAEWLLEISEFESSPDRPPSVRDSSLDFGTRSSFDASERATSPVRSTRGGNADFPPPLPKIVTSPPLPRPRTPSAGRKARRHSRKPSNSSISSAKVRLLQAESWKIKLPTDPGEGYGLRDTDRWSRMMDNIINGDEDDSEHTQRNNSPSSSQSALTPPLPTPQLGSASAPIADEGATADPAPAENVFESLRYLTPRSAQRIPMYDSIGRRIGVLDHGRFVTGGAASDDDNSSVAAQLLHPDGTAKGTSNGGTEFISVRGNLLRLSRDGFDVLVMEMVGGKLQIVAGTVEKLVARLADEGAQDSEFVDVFLTCHPFFIPSRDLLACLVARFRVRPAPDDEHHAENAMGSIAPQDEAIAAAWAAVAGIRNKVVGVLARWVKLRFEDFEADPVLHAGLTAFLEEIDHDELPITGTATRFLPLRNETDRVRRVATVQAMSICSRARLAPFGGPRSRVCPFPMEVGGLLSESSPLLEFEARQLARYLTVADARAFRSITIWDFVGKLKAGGEAAEEAERLGRIDAFARRSDMIRNWIALELTTLSPRKPRRKLLEKLILTAHYARAHGNFHTPLFILLALASPPVRRLKRTWDAVPAPVMDKLRMLERMLDLGGNMRELRRQIEAVEEAGGGGFVMFLPVLMKDATFVVEGNKEFVDRTEVVRGFVEVEGVADDGDAGSHHRGAEADDFGALPDDKNDTTITDLVPRAKPPAPLVNFDKYRTLTGILRRHMEAAARYAWGIHLHLPLPNGVAAPAAGLVAVPSGVTPNASTLTLAVDAGNSDHTATGLHPVAVQLPPQADETFERDLKEVVERRLAWCADEALGGREGAWMRIAMDYPESENELPLTSYSRGPLFPNSGGGPSSSSSGGPSSSRFGNSQTTTFYPASTGYNGYVYVTTTSGGPDSSSSDSPRGAGVMPPARMFTPSGSSTYAAHFHHHHQHPHHPAAAVFRRGSGASRESSSSLGSSTDSFTEYGVSGYSQQPVAAPAPRTWARMAAEGAGVTATSTPPAPRTWARLAAESQGGPTGSNAEAIRPQFRSKIVCELTCRHCDAVVCRRGMKAILLADMNIELFSTDAPPHGVSLVNDDYQTRNCFCRIRDVACLGCGNVIGYHVTQRELMVLILPCFQYGMGEPCEPCMEACNNGHFWMFHISEVAYADRLDTTGTGKALLWAHLPKAETDCDFEDVYDSMCR
ncbi:Protein fam72a [Geranomyces michiganensis]|nr:Protein fam72a [Geranomyces michiganensis]